MQCRPVSPLHCQRPFVSVKNLGLVDAERELVPLLTQNSIFGNFVEHDESQGRSLFARFDEYVIVPIGRENMACARIVVAKNSHRMEFEIR